VSDNATDQHGDDGGVLAKPKRLLAGGDRLQRRHEWLSFPWAVFKKFGEDKAGYLAALVAYYGFFSLFPLMLVMVTVLGYVLSGNEGLQERILDSTLAQFPVIGDQISQNVGSLDGNLFALLIGVAGALWAGLGALQAMEHAMDSVWDVPHRERPNFFVAKGRALLMLVVLGGGALGVAVLSSAATATERLGVIATVLSALLGVALAVLVYLVSFKVLTNRDCPWRVYFPGAVVGGVCFVIIQLVGGYYVGRVVKNADQTYGVFAVVIGLLSWMYLLAQFSVLAAEVNVVKEKRLWPRSLPTAELTDADRRALEQHAEVEERIDEEDVTAKVPAGERTESEHQRV
jgi:YihY family inner membrane protein